jgi:hypothetical protein
MTLGFKGEIPPSAAAAISASGLEFVVLKHVGYNRAESDAETARIRSQLGLFAAARLSESRDLKLGCPEGAGHDYGQRLRLV